MIRIAFAEPGHKEQVVRLSAINQDCLVFKLVKNNYISENKFREAAKDKYPYQYRESPTDMSDKAMLYDRNYYNGIDSTDFLKFVEAAWLGNKAYKPYFLERYEWKFLE
ncbi:hypothetical protein OZX69_09520 (plasmid) [Lactobacillus sp. ESL0731]|uniref:hypothetical protein n=1 Tax=unclassified Lactobacillus TaxID=2620435 RepID=UPI0023F900BA|nr:MULTISPECIES: hypothetical protein [unclassified Lactobacillus]WEV52119.1 hypothetical protein OZX63_09510 [Lactobacillus sp. ESL0700]WEV63248.1 hypothetical protein OZX69_09520 [Lactobacillus sp. ESL0731]